MPDTEVPSLADVPLGAGQDRFDPQRLGVGAAGLDITSGIFHHADDYFELGRIHCLSGKGLQHDADVLKSISVRNYDADLRCHHWMSPSHTRSPKSAALRCPARARACWHKLSMMLWPSCTSIWCWDR